MSLVDLVTEKLKPYPKRLEHVLGVKERALEFQKIYGGNAEAIETAALLHDYFKYDSIEVQKRYIPANEIEKYQSVPVAYHALSAAYYAKDHLGINDPIVFEAIYYHIWGKTEMKLETMILATADFCEKNRTFSGAKKVYELALKDLQQAFILSLEYTIEYLKKDGINPFYEQIEVLNYYKENTWNY
ncbi:bis(5'-nucleosyl)-tetraphosphatase (symmetrical) YqeK [Acholeplasma vituli]|uniref:bis(5'-nucleosyl)-tetraphosphatase (symmetrical) n=1 Tax=Paracholeplasma vituli TaxID=69473 RepID=A0ABT2PWQ8_9MOLU|nr:bis(5'-nucleosyl)-tetraphosphatase (symmetrical) YqeK [Paracholeplasma vituli]MCU0105389.1 bis(5'-nucleosyl)-tetraphosphatase (symmetrical) YqeK [Paracholeplasma vituli]